MDCSDLVLGGARTMGGEVSSCLANVPHFMSMAELDGYIHSHDLEAPAPFSSLDLSAPTTMSDRLGLPTVTVKPLAQLFREFQLRQSSNGKASWNHGTREFALARTKVEIEIDEVTKAKVRKQIWVGTPADLRFHHEQVKSMNLALLLFDQECQGIDSDRLFTRLRFFTEEEIRHVISDRPQKHFLWRFGQARPDKDHLALVVRHETSKSIRYAAFSLVIP